MKKEAKILHIKGKSEHKLERTEYEILKAFQKEFQIIESLIPAKSSEKTVPDDSNSNH